MPFPSFSRAVGTRGNLGGQPGLHVGAGGFTAYLRHLWAIWALLAIPQFFRTPVHGHNEVSIHRFRRWRRFDGTSDNACWGQNERAQPAHVDLSHYDRSQKLPLLLLPICAICVICGYIRCDRIHDQEKNWGRARAAPLDIPTRPGIMLRV